MKDGGTASEAASPPATGPKPEGFIDVIRPTALNGWAWIPEHPEVKVKLEVVSNGVVVGFTTADKYREDLKERGLGDGHHAFEWLFESAVARMDSNNITVRFAENKEVLGGSKDNNAAVKLGLLDTKVDQLARQNHRRELVMAQLSQRFLQLEKTLKAQAAQQDSLHGQIVESPRGESADPTALRDSLERQEQELIALQSFIVRVESRVKNAADQQQISELRKSLADRPNWLYLLLSTILAALAGALLSAYLPPGLLP